GVDAERDVRGLLVDRDHDTAGGRVEPPLRVRVADLGDALAHELRNVDVDLGRDLPGDDDEAGRDQRLAGAATLGIAAQDGVEDGVGDLVRDLVGVAFGDGFGGEEELAHDARAETTGAAT